MTKKNNCQIFCWLAIGLIMSGCVSTLTVSEVISPNLIKLSDGTQVRYAGLEDLPQNDPWFAYCRDSNNYLVLGKEVKIKQEPELSKDGTIVGYVYSPIMVGEKKQYLFVNAELVRHGRAKALPVAKEVKHKESWQKLYQLQEKEAKPAKIGIWSGKLPEERQDDKAQIQQ